MSIEVNTDTRPDTFIRRLLMTISIATGVFLLLLLIWTAADIFLLVFASILVAAFLHGLSAGLSKFTSLSSGWALAVVIVSLISLISLGMWWLAPNLAEQTAQLIQGLSGATRQLEQYLGRYEWIETMLNRAPPVDDLIAGQANVLSRVSGVFSTGLGMMANFLIIVVVGFYLASNPGLYTGGFVRLVPPNKRQRAREVLDVLGYTLRWWLIGRLTVMAINGIVTALGLWLLGVPLAFTLGLLTALLNFIPNLGPILAGIPSVLIALTQSPTQALYVILLYMVVQNLEGFLLTPLMQQYTVSIPPAVTITVQVLLGVLLGIQGVALAIPLMAVILVLVKLLYIEGWLGDPVDLPGRDEEKTSPLKGASESERPQLGQKT